MFAATAYGQPATGLATPRTEQKNVPLQFQLNSARHMKVEDLGDGIFELTTQGEDPHLLLRAFDKTVVHDKQTILAFEYFCPEGVDGLSVYYGPPLTGAKQFAAGSLSKAETWQPYSIDLKTRSNGKWSKDQNQLRLDFGRKKGITLRIKNLHLRELNDAERRSITQLKTEREEKLRRESIVNRLYSTTFSSEIVNVSIDSQQIVIQGNAEHDHLELLELTPEVSLAELGDIEEDRIVLKAAAGVQARGAINTSGSFNQEFPRFQDGKDQITSRWVLAEQVANDRWRLSSSWKYATDLTQAASRQHTPIKTTSIKGMGGISSRFELKELVELGVQHITVNIVLSSLIDAEPHAGWLAFESGGRQWYANPGLTASYDKQFRFASENDIVASAILLVNFRDSKFGKDIIHPEADRAGVYAMPNFTSPEGVAAYQAALEFLAQRYTMPDAKYGRISNWIIHNEVGFGWVWTNMGKQPPMLFMDHYIRSMRLVHNVARRYDPHARVFISLTHHWAKPTDPSWKSYCNRDLIDRLVESSQVEGDFAWGLAYHPYPENLRQADTWDDGHVTNDFDTPMITPRNIAVLDRWMHREEMLDASGNVRGVLLSEQGFNTPDYSQRYQEIQAAAFVYTWNQMESLKSIEAFHNHRWVDAEREGGLLLGLRKLPQRGQRWGEKKLAWDIYRMLDTEEHPKAEAFAEKIIERENSRNK